MIATADEYTQVLYDALDSMARGIEKEFANAGKTVLVALGVHDSIYHPQRFREQLREKAEATCLLTQCENRWFPDAEGWTNRYFVYADTRRDLDLENENWPTEYTAPSLISILYRWFLNRLVVFDVGGRGSAVGQATLPSLVPSFAHTQISNARARPRVPRRIASPRRASQRRRTMSLHSLKIDGVIISDDLGILVEDSERLQLITDLRNAVYRQGEVLITFSASLQISRVEDFDISSVVGFVTPQATPAAKAPDFCQQLGLELHHYHCFDLSNHHGRDVACLCASDTRRAREPSAAARGSRGSILRNRRARHGSSCPILG